MEDGPAEGIEPIDKWQGFRMGGQTGRYYIVYFGEDAPTSWAFELPKPGLVEGMQFTAEILDTWNMTVTPVEGVFTVRPQSNYLFADTQGRAIELPGHPWMALRLQGGQDGINDTLISRTPQPITDESV
jgi:hypothetical protein